jgi:FixJ family two-component response regulator
VTGSGPLVYLVDDDAAVLKGFARLLHAWGYRTRTFGCAQELLDVCAAGCEPPDCVLLDVHMPGLSGVELHLRLIDIDRSLPIVFLTGHMDPGARARAFAAGAIAFLQKPIGAEDLVRAVEAAVRRRRGVDTETVIDRQVE